MSRQASRIGLVLIATTLLGASLMAGCAKKADTNAVHVQIVSMNAPGFSPAILNITAGTKVTWTNKDSMQHSVVSQTGNELDSGLLSAGQTYSHTFNTPGTYAYECGPHPGTMKGTITVSAAGTSS